MRVPVYVSAALFLTGCSSRERDAAIEVVNRQVPDSRTARYGSLYNLKKEGGYDCIDVTFEQAGDHSRTRAAALLEKRGDNVVFKEFDEGNTCDELADRSSPRSPKAVGRAAI